MAVENVVLVHGAWGDGGHWRGVIPLLAEAGLNVTAVQNPLSSLAEDVHRTRALVEAQDGPTLLVGHSYGGSVISQAGHADNTAGLVYVAAFAPDVDDTVESLLSRDGGQVPTEAFAIDVDGFAWLRFDVFREAFCQDLDEESALVLARSQKPIHLSCLSAPAGPPAWKVRPSWYQVSTEDHTIAPALQLWMAERVGPRETLHLDAGHASLASRPVDIANMIIRAAAEA